MARKPVEATFTRVAATGRRRMNPYTGEAMQIGVPFIVDSEKAIRWSDMGEVEILEENVPFHEPEPQLDLKLEKKDGKEEAKAGK